MEVLSELTYGVDDPLDLVRQRVREAASWAGGNATPEADDLTAAYRTLSLPRTVEWLNGPGKAVGSILDERAEQISSDLIPRIGRLLAFLPEATLSDGAAEQESRGFFDADNVPPWDLWVGLFRFDEPLKGKWASWDPETVVLVSWIPSVLEPLCDRAIDVNPESCLEWLDDLAPTLSAAISPPS